VLRSAGNWSQDDLYDNSITEAEGEPEHIQIFKGKLSEPRLLTNIPDVVVRTLSFCVPLSNEYPS